MSNQGGSEMSNWQRSEESGSSFQQGYGNYYQSQNQQDTSQFYGNYYQQPYYNNSMVNGSSEVFGNGYQSGYQSNSTSAEEFFRMYQEQQVQSPQTSNETQSTEFYPSGQNYHIPTMVFPSSNSNSGGEVTHVKRKSEQHRSGGSGRFGGRNNFGAVPKQTFSGNNTRKGNYTKRGNHHQQQQNQQNQQTWAAIPNDDITGDGNGTKGNESEVKSGNKRGKGYGQRNNTRYNNHNYNNYQKDTNGVIKHSSYSKDWRAKGKRNGVEECQRDRLMSQLYSGTLECLVCCDRVRQADPVWSCPGCHHVFHLRCTVRWASSSRADNGWRCPACQNVTDAIPTTYTCMCGKVTNPQWVRGETPHTCGQVCGKDRGCPHQCTLLCHPGPCPPCSANIDRYCGCGRTKQVVQCSSKVELTCEAVCDKALNCKKHLCVEKCHSGPCSPCDKSIHQCCHCGQQERDVSCDENEAEAVYSCEKVCDKLLLCNSHRCTNICHPSSCPPCHLSPESVKTCPCGKLRISSGTRNSCKDPVPLCNGVCGKYLSCGEQGKKHACASKCHAGDCPPCPETTSVMCRCGAMAKEVACAVLETRPDDARCSKRCTKKRSCGKHKCNQNCCIEIDHFCPLPCNKTLSCGRHRCEELCHRGNCRPCLAASFSELSCECGKSVLYPPIPCGTRPPECTAPCSRSHPCGHPPTHHCHSQPECPPCSVLTTKYCFGAHELRKTVPCHMGEFSCGRACNKPLECGHFCIKLCHKGPCTPEGTHCTQPCPTPRTTCNHSCAASCHPKTPCNPPPCQAKVEVRCECGRRVVNRSCSENNSEYQRLATAQLASKMADVRLGKTIELRPPSNKPVLKLECSEECKLAERNLRLAIGLQISNPDLSSKLSPRYSKFLMDLAKKEPKFAQNVHEKLSEVVQLAKTSKQKSRSYSFPSMKSEKREFIHEYSEHFGIESVAYDAEPNRNVVATAYRDKSWLPSYSILEMLERAAGKRKVPSLLPSLKKDKEESMMVPVRLRPKSEEVKQEETKADEPPPIDYFDYVNPSSQS